MIALIIKIIDLLRLLFGIIGRLLDLYANKPTEQLVTKYGCGESDKLVLNGAHFVWPIISQHKSSMVEFNN